MKQKTLAFTHTQLGQALLATLIWQLAMTFIGYYFMRSGILAHTMLYDAGWYVNIIEHHYLGSPASPAFYPLFPLIIGAVQFVTFHLIPLSVIGFVVNTIFLWLAVYVLLVLAKEFHIKRTYLVPLFMFMAPAALFLHMFYTEPLFIMLSVWAYVFALRRQWLYVGILLALLTATRLPGLLIVGLTGLEFLRAYKWNIKRALNPKILYFLLAPLGFVLYGIYLYFRRGDFLAMMHAYSASNDWVYYHFNPNFIHTLARISKATLEAFVGARPFNFDIYVNHFLPIFTITLIVPASLYLIFKVKDKGIPLGVVGFASIIMFSINNHVVSAHRYALACFGVYIVMALIYESKRRYRPWIIALAIFTALLQIPLIYALYTANTFVG